MKERPKPLPEEKDDGKGFERFEEFTRRIVAVPKSELRKDSRKTKRKDE
jgi:hypothetical protein